MREVEIESEIAKRSDMRSANIFQSATDGSGE